MIDTTAPSSNDRVAAMLTHLGGIFFGFIPSLVVLLVSQNSSPWLLAQIKEALNFQLTMTIAAIVSAILILVLVGFFMLWAIGIIILVCSIIAAVKANQGQLFNYPLTFRMVK
ncbi:MAG: DUF4870 domain-containing protein [Vulcanimicrobiaceae bacterium]